jgi:outer membrane protein assembly factor BamB
MEKQIYLFAAAIALLLSNCSTGFCQESATSEEVSQEITADVFRRAARNGDLETVKKGIESGVDVDAKSAYGATALFFACDRGQEDVVNFLLEKGADPNAKDTFYKATPVTWSMSQENKAITLSLIKYGGKFEPVLLNAVSSDEVDFAKQIVDLKSDQTESLIKARDAALRIKDEKKKEKMVALFAELDLPEPEVIVFSKETQDALLGKFSNDRISVEITLDKTTPMIAFNGGTAIEIVPSAENKFSAGGGEASFEIEEGVVDSIDLKFGSTTFNLKRPAEKDDASEPEDPSAETESKPKFLPSSGESLAADSKISSANWPNFRGAGSRGVAEGQKPPINFHVVAAGDDAVDEDAADDEKAEEESEEETEKRENEMLLWQTPVEGLGLSSPAIWDDQIFITTAVTEGDAGELRTGLFGDVESVEETQEYEFKLVCYSKSTGEKLWERTANKAKPAVKRHSKSSHANPTVATNGKHVVAFFGSEGLYCYSNEGELVWKKDLGFLDSGWFYDKDYQWGFASSPAIHDGCLFVQCDIQSVSFLLCLDLQTGDEKWRVDRDEIPSWSSPTIHKFSDRTMVITNGTKSSRGYDAKTGELIWSMKGNSEIVVPTPNVAHGLIYVASGYAPIRPVYAIKPDAEGDISLESNQETNENVAWSKKSGGPYMPTPVIYGDYLYCCANNGIVTCYVAKSGEQVYKKRLKSPGGQLAFTASPLAADGHVYFTAEDGRVLVVKAGPEFEVVATNQLNQKILATPAISEGVMFFRTQNSLIAVGQRITD